MGSDRLKSILTIMAYAFIFIISEIFGVLFKSGVKTLLTLIYPSLAFWIALIVTIVIERKKLINHAIFVSTCMLSVLFLWAASFSMLGMYLPVTAFMSVDNIPFRQQVFRLPSIALLKTGWFLVLLIIFDVFNHKREQ